MKEYPTISRTVIDGAYVYAFDKLDGSNIRAEWSPKKGFYKFGSRNRLIGSDQPFLPESIGLIKDGFERDLSDIFKKERYDSTVCFFEFWGLNSFAGVHVQEQHTVTLFDISVYKKGLLEPNDYMKLVGHLNIAQLLYRGNMNQTFELQVRDGKLDGCSGEGVVCKGAPLKKDYPPMMFKIKTNMWIQRLRDYCKGNQALFNQLL